MIRFGNGRENKRPKFTLQLVKLFFLFIFIIQFALQSCAIGRQTMIHHSFDFDLRKISPDVEVLDFQYGDSRQTGTCAPRSMVKRGVGGIQYGTTGFMPRGEFLYVKWRIKSTGQIYEDRVDLSDRLPTDITDYRITFFMKGPQLYVYLISPRTDRRPESWPKGPIEIYDYLKQYEIYPAQPSW